MTAVEIEPAPAPAPAPEAAPRPRRRPIRRRRLGVTGVVLMVVLCYLVVGPILMLLLASFENTDKGIVIRPPFPWTLDNFVTMLTDGQTWTVLLTTLVFSLACLVIAFLVALAIAWLVERTDMPLRGLTYVLTVAPTGIPTMILALSWVLLANPSNGTFNVILRQLLGLGSDTGPFDVYSLGGMIFVQATALVPLTFLLVSASLRAINPNLEDSARASGASGFRVLSRVTIPLLTPVLVGALIYQFVNVIETTDIPLFLGLPAKIYVFSSEVYRITHPAFGLPDFGLASAYGILLLALAVLPLLVYNRVIRHSQDYATVSGKTFRPRRTKLGAWRWPAFALVMVYAVVTFVIPMLVLLYASFQPYLGQIDLESFGRMTLDGWSSVLASSGFWGSLGNTLLLGVVSSVVVMGLSVGLSWIMVRVKGRAGSLANFLSFMPHAMPGVVIALAVLLLYLVFRIGIYGTIWIVIIAMITQYLSLGTRMTTGGIVQIQVGLEEAGRTSGAAGRTIWWRVLLPLLRPVLLNGVLLVFLYAMKNLTLPLMLQSSTNTVLATEIWHSWTDGRVTEAAVVSVILTVITVVASILLRIFGTDAEERAR